MSTAYAMSSPGDILIVVPGHPVGKGRARSAILYGKNGEPIKSKKTGRILTTHYTPEKTRTWEGIARSLAMDAMHRREPLECPVRLSLIITFAIPDSWPQWKRALALAGRIEPTVKPDADNVEKAVKDALNGVAWRDDCQVVSGAKEKLYGEQPGVRILVSARETMPAQVKHRPKG